jgi:tripartite-type tricarboxylate transporter receptor subunit TctC
MKPLRALAAFGLLVSSLAAFAQAPYPTKPVRIIVPFAAGGVADLLPRIVGEKLSQKWGQPVVIENKPGASGNIGMEMGARAEPDGYTLVLAPTGNLTVNPTLFPKLPFDTNKDLAPITIIASSQNVLVVHPSVPAKTLKELIDYAKANPGKLNFASPGEGSGAHLAGELLNIEAGIKTVHVPYKGIAPAVTDLLAGNVQMMFAGISTVIAHTKAGRLVPIAIAGSLRSPQMLSVPTVNESGIPGFDVTSWYGLVVRAGTPGHIIRKIQHDVSEVLGTEEVREKLNELGLYALGNRPEDFSRLIQSETRKWSEIVRKANIQPQS